jgi:hypothetical protein
MESQSQSSSVNPSVNFALGLGGALGGGVLGWVVFGALVSRGLYALVVPGALLGLGCGLLVKQRSWALAAVCGVAALGLGICCEWYYLPFAKDERLAYFLSHLADLTPRTWLSILLGACLALYLALGWKRRA